MTTEKKINIGDNVRVIDEDWTATVVKIFADGDLQLEDGEGNDGTYSPYEVEPA
jgi:hypothetical protein